MFKTSPPAPKRPMGRGRKPVPEPKPKPEPQAEEKSVKKTHRHSAGLKLPVANLVAAAILVCLVVVMGCLGFRAFARQFYTETFTEGITVDGVDVSGLTLAEAFGKISEEKQPSLDAVSVTIHYEDNLWVFGGNDVRASATIEETLREASHMGRTGSLWERVRECWNIRRNGMPFETEMSVDKEQIATLIRRIASLVDKEAVDAQMKINPESSRNYLTVTEDEDGLKVDQEKMLEAIYEDLQDDWKAEVDLACDTVKAEISAEELKKCTNRRSYFETTISASSSANRNSNIRQAASRFNGMCVKPGQTVSFNSVTGERNAANGYLEAPGIGSNKAFEDTMGGGVCQVSTTLYNACLLADLDINERHRHSIPSTYVKTGFDAMVNWPNSDFKFTNTTDEPIFIRTQVTSSAVRFWIYGLAMEDGVKIDRESEVIETIPAPDYKLVPDTRGEYADYVTYTDEAYARVASRAGQTVQTWLVWYKNGQEIKRVELHTDKFAPIQGIHYVGTKKRPDGNTKKTSSQCYILGSSRDPATRKKN